MKKKEPVLKSFVGDEHEIIATYNEKQVTLGLLVKTKGERKKSEYSEFDILGPVLVNVDTHFGCVYNALSGEKYNAFSLSPRYSDETSVKVNRITTDLAKWFLDLPEDVGVISYTEYYKSELVQETKKYMEENEIPYTLDNVYLVSSRLKFQKIQELVASYKQESLSNQSVRVKTEEN